MFKKHHNFYLKIRKFGKTMIIQSGSMSRDWFILHLYQLKRDFYRNLHLCLKSKFIT